MYIKKTKLDFETAVKLYNDGIGRKSSGSWYKFFTPKPQMSRQASQDRMTIPHLIRKVKTVILKCLTCNCTNFPFVLWKLLEVRCDVLLEINGGFFFDRPLSQAHINKYKGQQGHIFFLAGHFSARFTNLLLYINRWSNMRHVGLFP